MPGQGKGEGDGAGQVRVRVRVRVRSRVRARAKARADTHLIGEVGHVGGELVEFLVMEGRRVLEARRLVAHPLLPLAHLVHGGALGEGEGRDLLAKRLRGGSSQSQNNG